MGKEFVVESLEDMCNLMCDNYIPKEKNNNNHRLSRNRKEHYSERAEEELYPRVRGFRER